MKTIAKSSSPHTHSHRWQPVRPDLLPPVQSTLPEPRLLTLREAAFHLGHRHRTTIMRWVREGRLRCIRFSKKAILFEPAELDRFVREHRASE